MPPQAVLSTTAAATSSASIAKAATSRTAVPDVEKVSLAIPDEGEEVEEEVDWLKVQLLKRAQARKAAAQATATKQPAAKPSVKPKAKLVNAKKRETIWDELDESKIWDLLQAEPEKKTSASTKDKMEETSNPVIKAFRTLPMRSTVVLFGDSLGNMAKMLVDNSEDVLIVSVLESEDEVKRILKLIPRGRVIFTIGGLKPTLIERLFSSVFGVQMVIVANSVSSLRALVPSEAEMMIGKLALLAPAAFFHFDAAALSNYQSDPLVLLRAAMAQVGSQASRVSQLGEGWSGVITQKFARKAGSLELRFDHEAGLPSRFQYFVMTLGNKMIPCNFMGISLNVLNSMELSESSRRFLFARLIGSGSPLPLKYMVTGVAGNKAGALQSDIKSELQSKLVRNDNLPFFADVDEASLWLVGYGTIVFDPVLLQSAGGGVITAQNLRKPLGLEEPAAAPPAPGPTAPLSRVKSSREEANSSGAISSVWIADGQARNDAGLWDSIKAVLPDANSPGDFSAIVHESGELSLKMAQAYSDATIVSYCSNPQDAFSLSESVSAMQLANVLVGNPLHYSSKLAHDPIERIVMDLKSSMDLFDFQFLAADFFAMMLHHPQSDVEKLLGQTFALSRVTVISVPTVELLRLGLRVFGGPPLDAACYRAKQIQVDADPRLSAQEIQDAKLVLALIACASDAANVETSARILPPPSVGGFSTPRSILLEVRLISMERPIGGLFKFGEEEGAGPRPDASQERDEGKVSMNNYALRYRRLGSGEETLLIARKDGRQYLQWKSPLRGRGVQNVGALEKGRGVSLYSILAVHPLPLFRRLLAQMFLRDADTIISPNRNLNGRAEPWSTFLYTKTLFYVWPFARDAEGRKLKEFELDDFKADHFVLKSEQQSQLELDVATGMGLASDIAALQNRWFDAPFSFVEHNSESGFAAAAIARVFQKSSVIMVTDTEEKRKSIERLLRKNRASNGLVVLQASMEEYGEDLARSPEHFNFQYFNGFYGAWRKDPDHFGGKFQPKTLGNLLSCAEVSYFLLPHPRILSLALAVFHGPDASIMVSGAPSNSSSNRHVDHFANAAKGLDNVDPSILELFEVANHPIRGPLKNFDFDLIDRQFESSSFQGISMQRVPVPRARLGASMGDIKQSPSGRWTLIRVMPTKMSRIVEHHYRAHLDGHKRRYLLKHWADVAEDPPEELAEIADAWKGQVPGVGRTWLVRLGDGGSPVANAFIPYTHFGVSLITLLRSGLSEVTKGRLYGQFLQIPMYEDMATWNIQWANGRLAYVDVDTMDRNMEQHLAHAYRLILALMNYERTVADFGKCARAIKMPFGIPYVGNCVRSPGERRSTEDLRRDAGCTDQLPVPCGDGECKATFVHCLRDMYEKELLGELRETENLILAKKQTKPRRPMDSEENWDNNESGGTVSSKEALQSAKRALPRPKHADIVKILPDVTS